MPLFRVMVNRCGLPISYELEAGSKDEAYDKAYEKLEAEIGGDDDDETYGWVKSIEEVNDMTEQKDMEEDDFFDEEEEYDDFKHPDDLNDYWEEDEDEDDDIFDDEEEE